MDCMVLGSMGSLVDMVVVDGILVRSMDHMDCRSST